MRFAPEGWPFVLPLAAAATALRLAGQRRAAGWGAASALGVLLFFRDPDRTPPEEPAVPAPASGVVTRVDRIEQEHLGPGHHLRIATFLSVFDVHVQRVPVSGRVVRSELRTGQKVAAWAPDADLRNEWHLTVIETPEGERFGVRQVTGLVARRIVCDLAVGQEVRRGERLGIIRFGSRVDLLLPGRYRPLVAAGDRVVDGETRVAMPG